MEITEEWIKKNYVHKITLNWFLRQNETDGIKLIQKLINDDMLYASTPIIAYILDKNVRRDYVVFIAKIIFNTWKKKYPNNEQTHKAIEATRDFINNPSRKNKELLYEVYCEVYVSSAAYFMDKISSDYDGVKGALHTASNSEKKETMIEILNFGLNLMEGDVKNETKNRN